MRISKILLRVTSIGASLGNGYIVAGVSSSIEASFSEENRVGDRREASFSEEDRVYVNAYYAKLIETDFVGDPACIAFVDDYVIWEEFLELLKDASKRESVKLFLMFYVTNGGACQIGLRKADGTPMERLSFFYLDYLRFLSGTMPSTLESNSPLILDGKTSPLDRIRIMLAIRNCEWLKKLYDELSKFSGVSYSADSPDDRYCTVERLFSPHSVDARGLSKQYDSLDFDVLESLSRCQDDFKVNVLDRGDYCSFCECYQSIPGADFIASFSDDLVMSLFQDEVREGYCVRVKEFLKQYSWKQSVYLCDTIWFYNEAILERLSFVLLDYLLFTKNKLSIALDQKDYFWERVTKKKTEDERLSNDELSSLLWVLIDKNNVWNRKQAEDSILLRASDSSKQAEDSILLSVNATSKVDYLLALYRLCFDFVYVPHLVGMHYTLKMACNDQLDFNYQYDARNPSKTQIDYRTCGDYVAYNSVAPSANEKVGILDPAKIQRDYISCGYYATYNSVVSRFGCFFPFKRMIEILKGNHAVVDLFCEIGSEWQCLDNGACIIILVHCAYLFKKLRSCQEGAALEYAKYILNKAHVFKEAQKNVWSRKKQFKEQGANDTQGVDDRKNKFGSLLIEYQVALIKLIRNETLKGLDPDLKALWLHCFVEKSLANILAVEKAHREIEVLKRRLRIK